MCLTASKLCLTAHFESKGLVVAAPAGFPCQSFTQQASSSGVHAHRTGWDERTGSLVWHVMRIACERRPAALLLENVRGLLTIGGGETLRIIVEALRAIGYWVDYALLNSSSLLAQV